MVDLVSKENAGVVTTFVIPKAPRPRRLILTASHTAKYEPHPNHLVQVIVSYAGLHHDSGEILVPHEGEATATKKAPDYILGADMELIVEVRSVNWGARTLSTSLNVEVRSP